MVPPLHRRSTAADWIMLVGCPRGLWMPLEWFVVQVWMRERCGVFNMNSGPLPLSLSKLHSLKHCIFLLASFYISFSLTIRPCLWKCQSASGRVGCFDRVVPWQPSLPHQGMPYQEPNVMSILPVKHPSANPPPPSPTVCRCCTTSDLTQIKPMQLSMIVCPVLSPVSPVTLVASL